MEFRVGIMTRDYDASLRFYHDALGFSIHQQWDRGGEDFGAVLATERGSVELLPLTSGYIQSHDGNADGANAAAAARVWLYIEVADVDAAYTRAKDHGATVLLPPTDEPWGHRRIRLRDPNGVIVGLFSRTAQPE